jgi:hypothetical protein
MAENLPLLFSCLEFSWGFCSLLLPKKKWALLCEAKQRQTDHGVGPKKELSELFINENLRENSKDQRQSSSQVFRPIYIFTEKRSLDVLLFVLLRPILDLQALRLPLLRRILSEL